MKEISQPSPYHEKAPRQLKYFTLLIVLNVTFQLISDATASKIILLFGFGVSVTVLYFPFTYIISDVLTEVYGYSKARRVLYYTILASVLAGLIYQLAIIVPPAPFFKEQEAYQTVFAVVPRVLIGGWIAVFGGDISNNYILARLKVLTSGKYLWFRTISSTVVGQLVNTALFYTIALSGVLPANELIRGVAGGWIMKSIVEAAMTPFTYIIVNKLKKSEGIDYYDIDTDFNPFTLKE
jgi:uncharacterized integral membrane protein (TIGR00697 family)